MIAAFGDLHGSRATFDNTWPGLEGLAAAEELAGVLGLSPNSGGETRLPVSPAVRDRRSAADAAPLEEGDPCLNVTIHSGRAQ